MSIEKKTKIVLLGKQGSGKTSLKNKLINVPFDEHEKSTIGVDFNSKIVTIESKPYKLNFWDVSGAERFKSLAINYSKSTDILLYCCDLSAEKDDPFYLEMNNTLRYFQKVSPSAVIIFIGTKTDLFENPDQAEQALQKVTQHLDEDIVIKKTIITSAKKDYNLDPVKTEIEQSILEQRTNPKFLLETIFNQLKNSNYKLHGGGVIIEGKKYPASAANLIKTLKLVKFECLTDEQAILLLKGIQAELSPKTKSTRKLFLGLYFFGGRDETTANIYKNIVSDIESFQSENLDYSEGAKLSLEVLTNLTVRTEEEHSDVSKPTI